MPTLADLQARLGYRFRDARLLRIALTHPSTAHEKGAPTEHNQRLEFLGDAVIQLILTRELYERFPADEEGPLTKARARLVNRRSLAQLGRALELGAQLILGGIVKETAPGARLFGQNHLARVVGIDHEKQAIAAGGHVLALHFGGVGELDHGVFVGAGPPGC